jgi:hypothetical protein
MIFASFHGDIIGPAISWLTELLIGISIEI